MNIKQFPVHAQIILITNPSSITFGNIFPGENLSQDLLLSLEQNINQVSYKISLVVGQSPLLCDFISVQNKESEGDNLNSATLLKPSDTQDLWQVLVSIPINVDLSKNYSSCALDIAILSYNAQPIPSTSNGVPQQQLTGGGSVPISFLGIGGGFLQENAGDFLPTGEPTIAVKDNAASFVWKTKN